MDLKISSLSDKLFKKGTYDCVPTDSDNLNKLLDGGLRTKNLYVIQAPSGIGKTTLLQRLCLNVVNYGRKALYVSIGEQDSVELIERFCCMDNGYKYAEFIKEYKDEERIKCEKTLKRIENSLYIDYTENPFEEIYKFNEDDYRPILQAYLEFCEREGIKYLFFDYLGACYADRADETYSYLGKCAAKLKNMASDHGLCVCTAMQTNRLLLKDIKDPQCDLKHIGQEYMSDSIQPAMKCSVGITFIRRNMCDRTGIIADDLYMFGVWKNRLSGQLGSCEVRIDQDTYRWHDVVTPHGVNNNIEKKNPKKDKLFLNFS